MTPYTPCPDCSGYGHVMLLDGLVLCDSCRGNCQVRKRDERGRFVAAQTEDVSS